MKKRIKNVQKNLKNLASRSGEAVMVAATGNPIIKDYADLWANEVAPSLISILSGNPSKRDQLHFDIFNDIAGGRYKKSPQPFEIDVSRFDTPFKTMWLKSSHGAYVFVKTVVPARVGKELETIPAYALLFSQHPDFLSRLFLRQDDENKPITTEEIEQKLVVIQARYERDIIRTNENNETWLQTGWVSTAIDEHNLTLSRILGSHGSIIRDGCGIARSGSSIFWTAPSKEDPDKHDCYYYANPTHGQTGLFFTKNTIQNPITQTIMRGLSIKLNKQPLSLDEHGNFSHQEFAEISRALIRFIDPYSYKEPDTKTDKVKRVGQKIAVRTLQNIVHNLRNMNTKKFSISMAFAGGVYLVLNIPFFAMAAAGKGNLLAKGGQTALRTFSKFLAPVQTLSANTKNDISPILASFVRNNFITDETRGLIVNPAYVKHMTAVPVEYMANSFPDAVAYDKEHKKAWGRSVILDTMGIQPGTIYEHEFIKVKQCDVLLENHYNEKVMGSFSCKSAKEKERKFLVARQPNGLDVYYDPEQLVAFAHKAREPFPHCDLEVPIKELFDDLPDSHHFIGIRHGENNKVEYISFESLNDIPEGFISERSRDMDDIKKNVIDIDQVGNHMNLQIVNVLPENERKKEVAKIEKRLEKEVERIFKSAETDYKTNLLVRFNSLQDTQDRNRCVFIRDEFNNDAFKCPKAINSNNMPHTPRRTKKPALG